MRDTPRPARSRCDQVTSHAVLIGWRAVPRRHGGAPRRGALALGCIALLLMGIVGCTTVTDGTAMPDTNVAPAYRSSVSASVSASAATSSIRESQRQQSLTTKAIRTSCDALAATSKDAIDKVNAYVAAFNQGRNTGPTEGPAIDALNNSASTVSGSLSAALSAQLGMRSTHMSTRPARWQMPSVRTRRQRNSTGGLIGSTTPRQRH